MTEEPRRARPDWSEPGAAQAVSWALADEATRGLARQTLEVLRHREVVERLAARYAASSQPHRAGHLFEVMHALSFNRHAAAQDVPVRTVVTEWVAGGSQERSRGSAPASR